MSFIWYFESTFPRMQLKQEKVMWYICPIVLLALLKKNKQTYTTISWQFKLKYRSPVIIILFYIHSSFIQNIHLATVFCLKLLFW